MLNVARWREHNDAYLSTALSWLRLKLAAVNQPVEGAPAALGAAHVGGAPIRDASVRDTSISDALIRTAPVRDASISDASIREARAQMLSLEQTVPPPALVLLREAFELSRFEQDILLLCAAMELDTRGGALCAQAHADPLMAYPTFALAMALFDEPEWSALSSSAPLRYWRLIEVAQHAATPLTLSPLRAAERITHFIKGLNALDERLLALVTPLPARLGSRELPPSQQVVAQEILDDCERNDDGLIQLAGASDASKQSLASYVAARRQLQLYRLSIESLPPQAVEAENLARLWQREAQLLPVALYLDAHDVELAPGQIGAIRRLCSGAGGLIFLSVREVCSALSDAGTLHDVALPTPQEQRELWRAALESDEPTDTMESGEHRDRCNQPEQLAAQFNLDATEITRIAGEAQEASVLRNADDVQEASALRDAGDARNGARRPSCERAWTTTLAHSRPRLDSLAQRLVPKATWDDIVLSAEASRLLHHIADQVRHRGTVYDDWGWRARMNRGLGISALFAGETGTGKTMAAEVLANALRLDLYRIDLSAVVSKYIGETEKNLRRLFDAAEHGGAILFFDEADALFGKRSEVKDSHDRYANIEINYLLQRMECYHGLAILATNVKSALDPAFMRRLRFIVNFAFPGPGERKLIWQRALPKQAPVRDLDFDRLARLNLNGATIHNIAMNAAFIAAAQSSPIQSSPNQSSSQSSPTQSSPTQSSPAAIGMEAVLDAARMELRKLDRATNEVEAV